MTPTTTMGGASVPALDYCIYEVVEITRARGKSLRKGYRYGLLAATRSANRERGWVITHLPTGLAMTNRTGVFPTAEQAAGAMVEIAKLKNDWLHVSLEDLAALSGPVSEIGCKFGGDLSRVYTSQHTGIHYRANKPLCERFV